MSEPTRRKVRRQQRVVARPHGWRRADDAPELGPAQRTPSARGRRAPAGTSFLLALFVGVMASIGIVRVHASTEVLELGAEITELTTEHAQLLEEKRRLAAERAYLRRPEQIADQAKERLGMIPVAPELVQRIRVIEEKPTP